MISYIIYVSLRDESCTDEEIDNILKSCEKNNLHQDITGVLLYSKSHFVQYLEGEYDAIMDLYNTIKKDNRHSNVMSVATSFVNERLFPSWAMGAKQLAEDAVSFDTDLTTEEADTLNKILSGEETPNQRAINVIKNFFN